MRGLGEHQGLLWEEARVRTAAPMPLCPAGREVSPAHWGMLWAGGGLLSLLSLAVFRRGLRRLLGPGCSTGSGSSVGGGGLVRPPGPGTAHFPAEPLVVIGLPCRLPPDGGCGRGGAADGTREVASREPPAPELAASVHPGPTRFTKAPSHAKTRRDSSFGNKTVTVVEQIFCLCCGSVSVMLGSCRD